MYCVILFSVFLTTYMIALSVIDEYIKAFCGSSVTLHYVLGITRVLGFVSFWLGRRFLKVRDSRRYQLIAVALIFIASAVILIIPAPSGAILPALFTMSFSLGHLGGLVYYFMSLGLETSDKKGRIIGISCALSIAVQFLLTRWVNGISELVTATILFLIFMHMILYNPADFILEDPLPYSEDIEPMNDYVKLQLKGILIIILVCVLLACRTDMAFVSMSFDGSVNIYSYPRLAMVPGYLIMGFAADARREKVFGAAFFSALLVSAVLVLLPFADSGYLLFLGFYYFFISVYIFFHTYSFISIAPRTKTPEFWASIGRPLSEFLTAIISAVMLKLGSGALGSTPVFYSMYYLVLLIAVYITMSVVNIDPNLVKAPVKKHEDAPTLDEWLAMFPLTPRERDVAVLLISGDLPVKAIAAELDISERSVYRYSSSIYEKTGAGNRTGLVKLYSGFVSRTS